MRKKTENMDLIVDKKTVRITTAVFVTVMTMLAAILFEKITEYVVK